MDQFATLTSVVKNPALDVMVILFFLAAGFLWGTLKGKSKLLSFLFSTYLALFLSPLIFQVLAPYKIQPQSYRDIGVYMVILIVLFIVLDRTLFRAQARVSYKWWQALLMSFLAVGLFVAGTLQLISLRGILVLSPATLTLFAGGSAYLFWAVAPIIGIMLVSRGK